MRAYRGVLAALLVVGAVPPRVASAQVGGAWNATITIQPYPSAFLADWQRNPQTAALHVLYTGTAAQDFHVEGYVRSADRGELTRVTSRQLSFGFGPVSQIFTSADILDWAILSRNQQYVDVVLRTGTMPEGRYDMCADVLSKQGAKLAQACAPFTITLPDPPQLIFPSNGAVVPGLQPVFQWTPVRAPVDMGVSYRVRVVEVMSGQAPEQALAANPSWYETDVTGAPMLIYPIDALALEDTKKYAWRVEARDADGNVLSRGGRTSEIWSFSPGGPGRQNPVASGVLPDVIDLVPGVARLKGLSSATVENRIATYALSGPVHLEVTTPTAFEVVVDATDLEIDKISLQSVPRVTAGSLSGALALSAIPGQLAGKFAQFDRIDYTPASGITLTAKLTLPGADPVALVGQVQLTAAGLFGSMRSEGINGAALHTYGDDPAALLVQSAVVTFPAGTVGLKGDVKLFKKQLACAGVTATFDAQGTLNAQVSCTPREPVALVAEGDRARLDLLTLAGSFTFNSSSKTLTYALNTAAQFKLDARPGGANCGANLALALNNGVVNVGEFAPRCDATEGESALGWLSTRLSSLTLRKFAYAPATGFDFELSVDMSPWIPKIPGFQLPPLPAVTITQAGFTIPDVDGAITHDPIVVAGFGIKVKHVHLPGFTLSWNDWQVRSASGFKFGFDADLTLPKIAGEAACLTAQPISITGAEISSRGLKLNLGERQFTPACGITLQADARLASSEVGLTEGTGKLPTGAWEEAYDKYGPGSDLDENARAWKKINEPTKNDTLWKKLIIADASDRYHRELEYRDVVRQKEEQLARVLDDRDCEGADLDKRARDACDAAVVQAKRELNRARDSVVTFRRANDLGPTQLSLMDCMSKMHEAAVRGDNASPPPPGCEDLPGTINATATKLAPLLRMPWLDADGKQLRKPDAAETRKWCDGDLRYAATVVNEVEQRSQYMGVSGDEVTQQDRDMAAAVGACSQQRWDDMRQVVCDPTATSARKRYVAEQALASETQRQSLGLSSDADESALGLLAGIADERQRQMLGVTSDAEFREKCKMPPPAQSAGTEGGGDQTPATSNAKSEGGFALRLELERYGGQLDIGFYPFFVVNRIPEIEGNIVLPGIFKCSDQSKSLTTKLRLGPRGEINGSVMGFIPACPLQLPGVELTITQSELTFSTEPDAQSVVLLGAVRATFTAGETPVSAEGKIAVDLLHGRFISGEAEFKGPFAVGFPREKPVVSFMVQTARLDTLGIHIDGRAELMLGTTGAKIGTTFDHVTINPVAGAITQGRILFDANFGLEIGVGANGALAWGATPNGAPLSVQSGVHIDLPSQIVLSSSGLGIVGDGGAHLIYENKDVANLVTKFSPGFTIGFNPVGIGNGMVDFQLNGVSMAYIDRLGFHPNLAYFANAVLPARLPLPSVDVAYLELRDASGNLRVTTENVGSGIRLYTTGGQAVPLIVPALQAGRPSAPRLDVTFDLTLDPLGQNVSLGRIAANVPAGNADAFDLSPNGLPFAIQTVAYERSPGGAYQWTLAGALKLFNRVQGGGTASDRVMLVIDNSGRLTGAVNLTPNQVIPVVEGSQNVALTLQSISGSFDANLPARLFRFNLSATAALDLKLSAQDSYHADATLAISDQGVRVENLTLASANGPNDFKYLDLSAVQLGLNNLRIPYLGYTIAGGFEFRMLFDAALRFPVLKNLTLPPISNIELTQNGFSIPAYEAPDLNLSTVAAAGSNATMTSDGPLDLGGFALNVKAFRMSGLSFNWFTGQGPTNWGFGFDLELGLGNVIAEAPQAFRDMRVQILNAGFRNGRFSGTIERLDFPTPLNIGIGHLYAISGTLPDPAATSANVPFSLTAELELSLGSILPICHGETQIAKPNSRLSIYGDGWFSGVIDGIVPTCPITDGPFQVAFTQSRVEFGYGNTGTDGARTRKLELAVAATATFPGITEGSTVTASGNVHFDLLQQKWIDGRIDVLNPFKYQPSDNNPYFAFNVDRASLDAQGLHFTGGGALRAKDGANIGVQFNNFTFALPSFQVTDGSVTFNSAFALGVGIVQGEMQWGVYSPTAPRPEGSSFRFVAPQSITIDGSGLAINGTATAELAFNGQTFSTLQVAFINGFKVGFGPVAVRSGRANFILGNDEIAHVDAGGFWPGNLFGVLPVPAKLGLPSQDVAYMELRDAQNNLLIETQTSATGLILRTRQNQPAKLVVPALKAEGQAEAPYVNVAFNITVNPATFQFVSGFVRAEAPVDAPALMSLEALGIPLTLRRIAFEPIGTSGVYGLRAAGRFKLPESLNNLKIDVPNLVITPQGIWGDVQMGAYLAEYTVANAPAPPVLYSAGFLGDTLKIDVTGVKLHFGSGANFAIKGQVSSLLFKTPDEPPTVLKWSGAVNQQGALTLQLDDTQDGAKLPIAFALFEPKAVGNEPALRITADQQEFKVRLSGVLTAPTLSSDFALTIAGLQLGTRGVVFPTISIQGVDPTQELRLFGAKFALKDSLAGGNVVYPALKVANDQGVMSVTLSGQVTFIDNISRFWGLKIATKGPDWISIAGANLLDRPLTLVNNVLTVNKATIENNALRTELGITLPPPLNGAGPQKVFFGINPNGQITGGTNLVVINQIPSLTASDGMPNTHFTFGPLATAHVRYVGLTLDFANFAQNSSVQVVTDFYLQNRSTNLIKLGDVQGNTVLPGLKIGFNGNVQWANLALSQQFQFDFEAVKLRLTNVSLPPVANGFAIGFSGKLSLNVAAVSGEVDFTDFTIGSTGVNFSPSGIRGGEFAIANVLRFTVSDFGYSATPTTIEIKGGGMPTAPAAGQNLSAANAPKTAPQSVQVASYVSFGGRLDVVGVFSGGVEKFLFYRGTDETTHLIIRQANLSIPSLVTFFADFRYDQTPTGFEMFMGAQGTLLQTWNVMLVGAFAQEAATTRAGVFLAVSGLNIQLGPFVTIEGLGGGFFVNPKPEWLEYVRREANVSQTAGRYIAAPASGFAVMLYGQAGIVRPELVKGRLLFTIADTYFRIDGSVVVLNQQDNFKGDIHLQIRFNETNVQGNVGFTLAYAGVVEGGGYLDLYVQNANLWSIYGTAGVKIIKIVNVSAEVIIGPQGFYFGSKLVLDFDIWIVKLEGVMEGQMWYYAVDHEFGVHLMLGVRVSIFGGLLYIEGKLHGVIIIEDAPALYFAATLKLGCPLGSWEGWAWVKLKGGWSAGLGQDPDMMAAINRAQEVAAAMKAGADETKAAIAEARPLVPAAVSLTDQQLAVAYQSIQGWSANTFLAFEIVLELNEAAAAQRLNAIAKQNEDTYRAWYYDVLKRNGLPGDTVAVVQYSAEVTNQFAGLQSTRPQVEARINELGASIQQVNPMSTDELTFTNPVRSVTQPIFRDETLPDGTTRRVLASAPTFDVDKAQARTQQTKLQEANQDVAATDLKFRQQIAALEAGLAKLRAATTTSDPGALPSLVGQYAAVASKAEQQFAAQADVILMRQDWMRQKLGELSTKDAAVTQWVTQKTQAMKMFYDLCAAFLPLPPQLRPPQFDEWYQHMLDDYVHLKEVTRVRVQLLAALAGKDSILEAYDKHVQDAQMRRASDGGPDWNARFGTVVTQANESGRQLFYEIARAGMTDADAKATVGFATLGSEADAKLGTIRQAHGSLSTALHHLYAVQAEATGALYDLYDRYIASRGGTQSMTMGSAPHAVVALAGGAVGAVPVAPTASTTSAVPTAADVLNAGFGEDRRAQLVQELTVPRVNNVSVVAGNSSRYSTQLMFNWSAWHPSGTYEFQFRDSDPASPGHGGGSAADEYYSNGGTGSLTGYRFTRNRSATSTVTRNFEVGVRGGAGFTGIGRTSYTVGFQQGASAAPVIVSSGALAVDNTPPSTPIVRFAGVTERQNAAGQQEFWSRDPEAVQASWLAMDMESGVAEFEYQLQAPNGKVIRPFTSVGGRGTARIDRLNLTSGTAVFVAVRARNGQGGVSAIGVSAALRYDITPPVFVAGSAITQVPAGNHAATDQSYAGCPVLQPGYPGATPVMPFVGITSYANTSWNGSLATTAPSGVPPRVTFRVPQADDPESGLGGYEYRVTRELVTANSGTGWTSVSTTTQYVTAEVAPLDYTGQFYIAIAPRNTTGGVGTPLTYGPFRVRDPTPPSVPEICVASGGAGALTVQLNAEARDDETGVAGYQYRVRSGNATLRNWTEKTTTDWATGGSSTRQTSQLSLVDGQEYFIDVRALNAQGIVSGVATSGPMLRDVSPPPAPKVSLALGEPKSNGLQELEISVDAVEDPHSKITTVQLAVGTSETNSDIVAWTSRPIVPGPSQMVFRIPASLPTPMRWVRVRIVNGVGLTSALSTASIRIPKTQGNEVAP